MKEYHPFQPFVPPDCRFILLGSFPGRHSTCQSPPADDWYYSAPRNQFWRIMSLLFPQRTIDTKPHRMKLMADMRIAVADIVLCCHRKGMSNQDINLKSRVYNTAAVEKIIREQEIKAVFFTGIGVRRDFRQHFTVERDVPLVALPSPSPAMFRLNLQEKTAEYRRILSEYGVVVFR